MSIFGRTTSKTKESSHDIERILYEHRRELDAQHLCSILMTFQERCAATRIMDAMGVPNGGLDAIHQIRFAYVTVAPAKLSQAERIIGVQR